MKRVTKDQAVYAMSVDNEPALTVAQGETFCVETEDCYSGNLKTAEDRFTKDMWDTVNPASGPVFIEGASPGDILRMDIEQINTRDYAVMCVEHGAGALADYIEDIETSILPIKDGQLEIDADLSVPIKPMIGVIGTAPEGEPVLNGTPGEHGGHIGVPACQYRGRASCHG